MAYQGSTNNVYQFGSADIGYAWKEALIAAGWSLTASGGGTGGSYSTSVDMVPTLASNVDGTYGRLGWNNSGAWACLREPPNGANPRRQYVFMRGSATNSFIIKYSRQTGFITSGAGSGTANTLPTTGTGGDGVVMVATSNLGYSTTVNNDAAITAATSGQTFTVPSGAAYVSCIASDVAVNGVFGFWLILTNVGTGSLQLILFSEGMSASSTPQAPSPDNDPSIRQVAASSFWNTGSLTSQNAPSYWQAYGTSNRAYLIGSAGWGFFSGVNAAYTTSGTLFPNSTTSSLNPYNARINVYPVLFYPNTAGLNPKGYSSGMGLFNVNQNQLDTFNLSTSEPRIVIASRVVMPWKQGIVPLV